MTTSKDDPEDLAQDVAARLAQAVGSVGLPPVDREELERAWSELADSEERHRSLTESSADAIIVFDAYWRLTGWNPAAERIFGYPAAEALGKSVVMLLSQRTLRERVHEADVVLQGGTPALLGKTAELFGRRRDGQEFPFEVTLSSWQGRGGLCYSAIVRDVTDRRLAEEKMSTLAVLVESTTDAIVSTDLDGVITNWNPGAVRLYGYTAAEATGRRLWELVMIPGQPDWEYLGSRIGLDQPLSTECTRRRQDDTILEASVTLSPVRRGTEVVGRVEISRDVTEQRRAERVLRDLAHKDPLTGLANRRSFLEKLRATFAVGGPGGGLLFLDLDGFKSVNDRYGHQQGDEVLCALAAVLETFVPPSGIAARLAGDEFTVLVPAIGSVEALRRLALRIHRAVGDMVVGDLHVVASIGGTVGGPGASPHSLLAEADTAMYEAKQHGLGVSIRATAPIDHRAEAETEADASADADASLSL